MLAYHDTSCSAFSDNRKFCDCGFRGSMEAKDLWVVIRKQIDAMERARFELAGCILGETGPGRATDILTRALQDAISGRMI